MAPLLDLFFGTSFACCTNTPVASVPVCHSFLYLIARTSLFLLVWSGFKQVSKSPLPVSDLDLEVPNHPKRAARRPAR